MQEPGECFYFGHVDLALAVGDALREDFAAAVSILRADLARDDEDSYRAIACRRSRRYALSSAATSTWCSSAVNRVWRDRLAASFTDDEVHRPNLVRRRRQRAIIPQLGFAIRR